ncbi:hypothetical protein IPdc08_01619 [archaeon]|nr:hypothetical protein IPdc08_01619 [archaeon]
MEEIDKIIRTKRTGIALQITDDATLIVRAPLDIDTFTIENIVLKHKKWIEKKKKEILSRDPKFSRKKFVDGENFLYLGESYRLTIVDDKTPLKFENRFYLSKEYQTMAKEIFIKWYKEKAHEKISERVQWYASKKGLKYSKINITNDQKRWGSCSPNGNLNFSWRLIMAPLSVIDYVVVHELIHLEERNHSKSFWLKVKTLMQDYEIYKKWLRYNGYLLRIE